MSIFIIKIGSRIYACSIYMQMKILPTSIKFLKQLQAHRGLYDMAQIITIIYATYQKRDFIL